MVPMEPTPAPLNKLDDFFGVSINYLLYRTDVRVSEKQDTKNSQLQTPADANKETATDDIKELLLVQNLQEEDLKLLKQIARRLSR